jgi:hypothetical protein
MNESESFEICFAQQSPAISPEEIALLKPLLPEILREMLEAEEVSEDD